MQKSLSRNDFYAAVITGRITGLARPFVCPPIRAPNSKAKTRTMGYFREEAFDKLTGTDVVC